METRRIDERVLRECLDRLRRDTWTRKEARAWLGPLREDAPARATPQAWLDSYGGQRLPVAELSLAAYLLHMIPAQFWHPFEAVPFAHLPQESTESPTVFDPQHPHYPSELDAAVIAWRAIARDFDAQGGTFRQQIGHFLANHYESMSPDARERIASVCTPERDK